MAFNNSPYDDDRTATTMAWWSPRWAEFNMASLCCVMIYKKWWCAASSNKLLVWPIGIRVRRRIWTQQAWKPLDFVSPCPRIWVFNFYVLLLLSSIPLFKVGQLWSSQHLAAISLLVEVIITHIWCRNLSTTLLIPVCDIFGQTKH